MKTLYLCSFNTFFRSYYKFDLLFLQRDDTGSLLNLFNFVDHEKYPTWEEYLEKMARDGTWGDQLIIEAAARYLNCVVHIISSHAEIPDVYIKPESTTCDVDELLLGHIHEYHYVSLESGTASQTVILHDFSVQRKACPLALGYWILLSGLVNSTLNPLLSPSPLK